MGQILALLAGASWGISNVYARKGMEEEKKDKFVGLFITLLVNNMVNVVVLGVYLIVNKEITVNKPGLLLFALGGVLNSFIGRGTHFVGVSLIGAARAGVVKITSPIFAIVGGVFLLHEVMSGRAWLGILVCLLGVLFISIETMRTGAKLAINNPATSENNLTRSPVKGGAESFFNKHISQIGIAVTIVASMFVGTGNVFRKAGIAYIPSSLLGVIVGCFFALLCCTVFLLIMGKRREMVYALTHLRSNFVWTGLYTVMALYLLFLSLIMIPLSIANSIMASESLFTMFAGMLILGRKEALNARTFIGAVIVIGGIVLLFTL